jgi:hypothetical protein
MEKLQDNTKKNGKESFNGTPKPIIMGCCQKKLKRENLSLNFV